MPKRLNPNLAKIHYSYSVSEVAETFQVHPHTVRNWIKAGLPTVDEHRPVLIQGSELREYLTKRNQSNKRPCAIDEIYCLKCRRPQKPAERMADYMPSDASKGCLTAICPVCECVINRFMGISTHEQVKQKVDVNIRPVENT